MAQGKKSFLFYTDWKSTFDELSNEQAGELIKHILAYVNDENPTSENILIRAVFANIKATLKRDLVKYEDKKIQWSDAGKASAEARKLKNNNDRSTDSTTVENSSTDSTDNVNVIDNVKVNVKDTVKDKIGETPKTPLELKFNEFLVFRKQKRSAIVPASLQAFKDKLWKLSGQNEETAIKILDESIANGWTGIFALKNNNNGKQDNNDFLKAIQDEFIAAKLSRVDTGK
jgi:hypothetical protein